MAKLPLALYVPQFEDVKKGASYNPFLRDRVITSLAMTCRGEFSFIIAAFALGEGLFTAQMYAAIVWAVLLSCVSSPFMLLNVIKYFDKKRLDYLASTNPIKLAKGEDGSAPFFLHIKVSHTCTLPIAMKRDCTVNSSVSSPFLRQKLWRLEECKNRSARS